MNELNKAMKTKFILFIIAFIFSFNTYSQNNTFEVQRSIFEKAKSYNDPNVAISALYNMIALQPENILLKDSLMREYLDL